MGKEKKMLIGFACNCNGFSDIKFLILSLISLFSLLTLLQLLPTSPKISISSLRNCITNISAVEISPPPLPLTEEVLPGGAIKRRLRPYGSAAYAFILMSAYRTGPDTFSLIGLSAKSLDRLGRPSYTCQWVPHNATTPSTTVIGRKILPDWGYGRVYTTVVITCTFSASATSSGGKLFLTAAAIGGDTQFPQNHTIEALTENPQIKTQTIDSNLTRPRYDYLYCGSSLYGDLSPQRIREWIAYHVRLFGERSHFVFHDAGGVHTAVMEVLRPWMELGYVTLHDIREQERFDGYYHNQFLIVNDCLHRYRFDAKWMFFFDVDEFLYLPKNKTIKFVTDSLAEFSQFTFEQIPMSNQLCSEKDKGSASKKWGFEKLIYREAKRVGRRDRKYAVQPQNVLATGVHISQNLIGKTNHRTWDLIKYFHYHGTVSIRNEPCREFTNATSAIVDQVPYIIDATMRDVGPVVREFELKMIGSKLSETQQ